MGPFSPAQIVGYIAFVLGITAFLQKSDRRLKLFNGSQSLAYALHFVLLGNVPASAISGLSSVRSYLSVSYRSLWLATAIIAANLVAGAMLAKSPAGWIPVIASCTATIAMFTMRGIPFRLALLGCTLLWLTNNILSGSIGGTALELAIAGINISTIFRLMKAPADPLAVAEPS